jgi:multicomponent Na+:H+ antiporter subunit D
MTSIGWTIAAPLLGTIATLFVPRGRWTRLVGISTVAAAATAALVTVLDVRHLGGARYAMGGWAAPLGIELRADGIAALAALTVCLVMLALSVSASAYFARGTNPAGWRAEHAFWPIWLVMLTALVTLTLSSDAFNIYVGLEVLTIAAVGLVVLSPTGGATAAATQYLLAAMLASLAYLLGVAFLYAATGTLELSQIAGAIRPGPLAWGGVALVTGGLLLKGALFPLHFWLPRAHANAPPPVSAALSGLVVAAAFYVLLRLWVGAFAPVITPTAAQSIGALGALAIIWGGVQALRQQRLKLLVAYSTVSQAGYFALMVPLVLLSSGVAGDEARIGAWHGGLYLMGAHAFAKAAFFLAAGTIAMSLGHDRIVGVRGIATHLPVTTYAFGIAGLSLIGLPPSGGFVGKWALVSAAIASGQWWWLVAIVIGGMLTAGYVFLVLGQEMSEASSDAPASFRPVPRLMEYTAMALALASLAMGLAATGPLATMGIGAAAAGAP